ncbi:hypothetical protein ACQ4PT_059207 [Festuca glaucescens]
MEAASWGEVGQSRAPTACSAKASARARLDRVPVACSAKSSARARSERAPAACSARPGRRRTGRRRPAVCRRRLGRVSNMSKSCDAPKTEWPELLGRTIKEAKEKIKADRPDLNVHVVTVGTMVTLEVDENRVRIWVDTVAQIPKIG